MRIRVANKLAQFTSIKVVNKWEYLMIMAAFLEEKRGFCLVLFF